MFAFAIVFWYLLIVLNPETTNAQYANDTVQKVRLIGDDFRLFQKTGKRISGRDGRRLISFDTRNDNIEVMFINSVRFIKGIRRHVCIFYNIVSLPNSANSKTIDFNFQNIILIDFQSNIKLKIKTQHTICYAPFENNSFISMHAKGT